MTEMWSFSRKLIWLDNNVQWITRFLKNKLKLVFAQEVLTLELRNWWVLFSWCGAKRDPQCSSSEDAEKSPGGNAKEVCPNFQTILKKGAKGEIFHGYGTIQFILTSLLPKYNFCFFTESKEGTEGINSLMQSTSVGTGLKWRILPPHTWLCLSIQNSERSVCDLENIYFYIVTFLLCHHPVSDNTEGCVVTE